VNFSTIFTKSPEEAELAGRLSNPGTASLKFLTGLWKSLNNKTKHPMNYSAASYGVSENKSNYFALYRTV